MPITLYAYPKCGTCRKAKKWFEQNDVEVNEVHIVENPPSKEELAILINNSGLPIKKFFNTSGQKYRELGLKDQVANSSHEELLQILASDGMLLKRPIVTDGQNVTVGFKEDAFEETWKR